MTQKQRKALKYSVLTIVFISMCVLRIWYTMLIIFGFGLVLTLAARRRNFCSDFCPMGTMQDTFYRKHDSRNDGLRRMLKSRWFIYAAAVIFWTAAAASIFFLHATPDKLWQAMLGIMLGSAAIAVLLQDLTVRRVWCSTICPYGNALGKVLQQGRTASRRNSQQ